MVLALIAAGCGSASGSDGAAPPSIPTSSAILTPAQARQVPLATYVLSPEDAAVFQNATIIKANLCATRFGIQSTMIPDNVRLPSDALLLDNRYGVVDLATARRFGYSQKEPGATTVVDNSEKGDGGWNPTPLENEVMTGVNAAGVRSTLRDSHGTTIHDGGCLGQGGAELQNGKDDRGQLMELVQDGLSQATQKAQADDRLIAAEKRWATCMGARGYDFTHKSEAVQSVADKAAAEQVKTATDDVDCAHHSQYLETLHALDVAYENQYISSRSAEFKTAHDGVMSSLARARRIVTNGS